jgi:hypothetical protein
MRNPPKLWHLGVMLLAVILVIWWLHRYAVMNGVH